MPSSETHAAALTADVAGPLGAAIRLADIRRGDPTGYRALTGPRDGPPVAAPDGPIHGARAAAAVLAAYSGATPPIGDELLTQRALLTGLRRNAPWSAGGACRILPCADGWLALSLARGSDRALVAALVEAPVEPRHAWGATASWLRSVPGRSAHDRMQLLGLPAALVPAERSRRRPGVLATVGGGRPDRPPLVVNLAALWAGPLCASLLGGAGWPVVCVESTTRPDPSREAAPAFHEALHRGHRHVRLDLVDERDQLVRLLSDATVVVEGSRPRALRQLGIDARSFVAAGTIWCSITAYGRAPGDEMRIGFGDDVAAGAGLVAQLGRDPIPTGDAVADPLAGVHAAAAVAIAATTDHGALLDVSMHDVARSLA